jgi:hypothetical protein
MEPLHFHYPAVFTAAIVSFAIGGLWYSPILFSQAWMKACGISEEQARAMNVPKVFGLALLASLVMAFNLAAFLAYSAIDGRAAIAARQRCRCGCRRPA